MSSPDWKMAVAADGHTEIRTRRSDDATISIRLTSGAVSIVASVPASQVKHLFNEQEAA